MKWMTCVLACGLVAGLIGCNTNPTKSTTVTGSGDKKLTLTPPANETITQGKEEEIKVAIERKNFEDGVEISFSQLPQGVTIKESEKVIAKGSNDRKFTLVAAADAPVKEGHVVKVTAKGPGDMSTTSEFKINVKAK